MIHCRAAKGQNDCDLKAEKFLFWLHKHHFLPEIIFKDKQMLLSYMSKTTDNIRCNKIKIWKRRH